MTGSNNGQITQFRDAVSGEQVTYAYDGLNRLITATAAGGTWSENYTYDGFGNLLQKTATDSAPVLSVAVDPATNRMVGQSYDANGNLAQRGGSYDFLNRLAGISPAGSNLSEAYVCGPQNERVEKTLTAFSGMVTREMYSAVTP